MKLFWLALTAGASTLAFAGVAAAQTPVYFGDVDIVYQPQPTGYHPEGSEIDLADQGKRFDIACTIAGDGKLSNCQARSNNLVDQNFVRIAVANISQWVVAPKTHDGQPSLGRTMLVSCQFQRSDHTELATADGAK